MEGGPPGFPRDSSCPAVLWILLADLRFRLRGSHTLRPAFPCRSVKLLCRDVSPQPRRVNPPVCPLPRSLATTCGISVDFSSSPYLDVSVQAVPRLRLFDSTQADRVLLCRVSPFGNPGIEAYVQLPQAYRSLSRPSSAPDAKAFPLRSYQLDLTGSQELCRLQIRFIVVCVTLLISKKSTNFTLLPLCCLLAISCLLHCSVFKVQVSDPSSRSDRNARSLDQTLRFDLVVEVTGLEPVTPCLQSRCSTS